MTPEQTDNLLDELLLYQDANTQEDYDTLQKMALDRVRALTEEELSQLQFAAIVHLGHVFLHAANEASDMLAGALIINHGVPALRALLSACDVIEQEFESRSEEPPEEHVTAANSPR